MAGKKSADSSPGLFDDIASESASAVKLPDIPASWLAILRAEFGKPYYRDLVDFVAAERAQHQVFPQEWDVFSALIETPYERVRVLILGQDPYHDDDQAHGMCFSVRPGVALPPSLRNIFAELKTDLGCGVPANGCLIPWALQGVLLLNAVLTVRAHEAGSHQRKGWEIFTDAVIRAVSARLEPIAFVLWGAQAQKKAELIDANRHLVIQSAHPSPLSASKGFFGSRPFSKINAFLREHGAGEIDWQL